MARGRTSTRIEPTFDTPMRASRQDGLSISADDRVVLQAKRKFSASKKQAARTKAGARRGRAADPRRKSGGFRTLGRLVYWGIVLAIWAGIVGAGIVVYYGARMPSATTWTVPDRPPNIRIVDVGGRLLANRGMTGGEAIALTEMSPYIPQAVIAIEDRRFNTHFGIDPIGLARATVANLVERRFVQGGSTLTQQLAKNLFLKPDRTIERKVQEVLLALWLEHTHSKDQILEMYLNRVYFGSGAYGVEAASRRYFGKPASDVTLAEAALLAGLLKAPSRLSPARDPKAAEERAQIVLAAMSDQGMISASQLTRAMAMPATRAPAYWTGSEHYVADRVMEELPGLLGEITGDLIVETTVDFQLQQLAERSIRQLVEANREKLAVTQGALVSIDSSGAVRAMVGGADYASSQFDRASEARRQPGSAFKPFVYLAALEQGRTPDSIRNDAPVRIGNWRPENYGGKYFGNVTLTESLARSLNSVAAQLIAEVGPRAVIDTARRLGIESTLQENSSLALGTSEVTPLELVASYVPFANGGYRPEIHLVQRVTDASGKILYSFGQPEMPRVLRPAVVGMMNAMMTAAVKTGTARRADFGWPAAGKTGTSQNSRDAWFVGYTANLTTGVWFGNDDGSPTKAITGGALPAEAWREFMLAAHEGVPVQPLPGGGFEDHIRDVIDALPADEPAAMPMPSSSFRDDTPTAGIPRPPADVGGGGRIGSIMDIILGN